MPLVLRRSCCMRGQLGCAVSLTAANTDGYPGCYQLPTTDTLAAEEPATAAAQPHHQNVVWIAEQRGSQVHYGARNNVQTCRCFQVGSRTALPQLRCFKPSKGTLEIGTPSTHCRSTVRQTLNFSLRQHALTICSPGACRVCGCSDSCRSLCKVCGAATGAAAVADAV